MADLLTAADESVALEDLHTKGFTDGLPVIIPTPARVSRMVLATGLEADMVLGTMGPGHGIATIEKVAVAAVMAGCLPDYMPVVLAAVKAVIDPVFDLTEMQATTHCTAPLIIVNGPARHNCGPISSSYGALGPGHRANASIGRALRLAMINIGGGRPGTSDMALLGHPGKFTFCLAEDEENSPFPPMHVDLGFDPDDSVVTVIGAKTAPSKIQVSHGDERAVRLSGTAFLRLQNLDQRNLAREHLIEVEPVRTYKVGLASPRERFQSVGREAGIANEQPARPRCLSADLPRKGHEIGKADLRAVPFRFD